MSVIEPYSALALQMRCDAVNQCSDAAQARDQMMRSIGRCEQLIRGSTGFVETFAGETVRLVVLPEYFLSGFPMGESAERWLSYACLDPAGPEYEALGQVAQDCRVFLSGNVYESDPNFPGLYFQASFILSDSGERILCYRRLISMFAPTPHDVLDRYLDCYGEDSLFPVVDTPLGRLACIASEEILYPEIARALALRGAEVICHSSSEIGSRLSTPKNIAKQARAYENMAYVVSANSAGIENIPFPAVSTDGHSQVVDFKGRIVSEAAQGESMVAYAEIEIERLRRVRRKPAMTNLLARQRLDLFQATYADAIYPPNNLIDVDGGLKAVARSHFKQTQQEAFAELKLRGVI